MGKNVIGESMNDSPDKPPNNGHCPECGSVLVKKVTGWVCKPCDREVENDKKSK